MNRYKKQLLCKVLGGKKKVYYGTPKRIRNQNSVGGKGCYVRGAPTVTMTTAYEQGANSDMHDGPAATQTIVKIL